MFTQLFIILKNTVQRAFVPIITKFRILRSSTSRSVYFRNAVVRFFTKHFSVKPRDKDDYFAVWKWLISKRLVITLLIIIGVVSGFYITTVNPIFQRESDGIKSYKYNSVPLRLAKGKVKIKAKSGYVAYIGDVSKGQVKGEGTLYNKDGGVVYTGTFAQNQYNGTGTLYYPEGLVCYEGAFKDNQYNGEGTLYRRNGSKEYTGEFKNGMKDGEGVLYNTGNNQVFSGNFSRDCLMYSDFLGKATQDITGMYTGQRTIYQDEDWFAVAMDDRDAIYCAEKQEQTLNEENMIESIYVLSDTFLYRGQVYTGISEIQNAVENLNYDGNSMVTMPEAVAIRKIQNKRESNFEDIEINTEEIYSDVITVNDYESDYYVYLYSFIDNGIQYTFFCADQYGNFDFYLMEKIS